MSNIEFSSCITISASAGKVWQTIVNPVKVAEYHLAPLKVIEPTEGGRIIYGTEGAEMIVGKIVKVVPDELLVHTFRFGDSLEGTKNDPETTVTYKIEANDSGATLTLSHTGFPAENQTYANIAGGWPFILEGLKATAEKD